MIEESAFQVYASALAFSKRNSATFRSYRSQYVLLTPEICSSPILLWPSRTILDSGLLRGVPKAPYELYLSPDTTEPLFFSPNSSRLISITEDGSFSLWDARSGVKITDLRSDSGDFPTGLQSFVFSADSHYLVAGSDTGSLYIWNAETGRKIREISAIDTRILAVAFSPTDALLASDGHVHGLVQLWRVTTGEAVGAPMSMRTNGYVAVIVFSPDGTRIATLSKRPNYANIWETVTGKHLGVNKLVREGTSGDRLIFSPSGTHLAVSGGSHIYILDGHTAQTISTWTSPRQSHVWIFTPNNTHLIWSEPLCLHVWNLETTVDSILDDSVGWSIVQVSLSPRRDKILVAEKNGEFRFWDSHTLERITGEFRPPPGRYDGFVVSPDWTKLAVNNGTSVHLYDMTEEDYGAEERSHAWLSEPTIRDILEFSPSGDLLLSGCDGDGLRRYEVDTANEIEPRIISQDGEITSARFSPDSRIIITGTSRGNIYSWDALTGENIGKPLIGHSGAITDALFSPDGLWIISTSMDATIRLWTATGKSAGDPFKGAKGSCVTFSFDGKMIAFNVGEKCDYEGVEIWSIEPKVRIGDGRLPVNHYRRSCFSPTFSPDGGRVAFVGKQGGESSSSADLVDVWRVAEVMAPPMRIGIPVEPSSVDGPFDWKGPPINFSDDGAYLLCHGYLWDITSSTPVLWEHNQPPSSLKEDPFLNSLLWWDDENWISMVGSFSRLVHVPRTLGVHWLSPWRAMGTKFALFREPYGVFIVDCSRLMR